MNASPPSPQDVLAQYLRVREALQALVPQYERLAVDSKSRFYGMTRPEFEGSLQLTAEELDDQTVLMLAASTEAVLRRDFRARVAMPRNRRQSPEAEFIALFRAQSTRVRLEQVLGVWRSTTGESLHDLPLLLKRRHWLAHGRYWSDKSGFSADPEMVFNLVSSVFQAFQTHTIDFPRSRASRFTARATARGRPYPAADSP